MPLDSCNIEDMQNLEEGARKLVVYPSTPLRMTFPT